MAKKKGSPAVSAKGKPQIPPSKKPAAPAPTRALKLWPVIIVLITGIVYYSSLQNGFTNWDDEDYLLQNELTKSGSIPEIFSRYVMGNYHPVTVLFLQMEWKWFGENAMGYHVISLLLNLLNSLLFLFFVYRLLGNAMAAGLAALLFAIHPTHVESVAWVSAQKDLLYTGFYFGALIAYTHYVQGGRREKKFYAALLLCFLLSLLSKAQAVTLPVVLVLMDWLLEKKISFRHTAEKIPFFLLSLLFGITAIFAQQHSTSIQELHDRSFLTQLLLAFYALTQYLLKFLLPINLSAYYSYPEKTGDVYPWLIYTSPLLIGLLGYWLFRFRNKSPELLFGVCFFLVNIFLVLQLLPVGGAIIADRYTYLSYAGLFIPVAFYLQRLLQKEWRLKPRSLLLAVAAGWFIFLGISARARTRVWQNSGTLWSDAIRKNFRLPNAHNNLASYYLKKEETSALAKKHLDIAIDLQPDFAEALVNRSDYFRKVNQPDSAIIDGNNAIRVDPLSTEARQNRGIAYCLVNQLDSAQKDFQFVIQYDPDNERAYNNLGNLYMMKGIPDSAIQQYNAALRVNPDFADVLNNRGKAFVFLGNYSQAVADLNRAIEIAPAMATNYYFRMLANYRLGHRDQALADANRAQALGLAIAPELLDSIQRNLR